MKLWIKPNHIAFGVSVMIMKQNHMPLVETLQVIGLDCGFIKWKRRNIKMSDGISDAYRDERRARCYECYIDALVKHLRLVKNNESLKVIADSLEKVIDLAKATDTIPRGLFGNQTAIAKHVEERIQEMVDGNEAVWTCFLSGFNDFELPIYQEAKALSPFAGKPLVFISPYYRDDGKVKVDFVHELLPWQKRRDLSEGAYTGFIVGLTKTKKPKIAKHKTGWNKR